MPRFSLTAKPKEDILIPSYNEGGKEMKKETKRLLSAWLPPLLCACLIFFFSSQTGAESGHLSGRITRLILHFLYPAFSELPLETQSTWLETIGLIIRKGAHFTEFALLGFFIRRLLHFYSLNRPLFLSWLLSTLYACTDEIHQLSVGGRSGMWQDVLIDSAGALFGVFLFHTFQKIRHRKQKTDPQ